MSTDMLKQCGLRQTAGRKTVLDVLEKADTPLTAEQIHALACQESRMGCLQRIVSCPNSPSTGWF